MNTPQYTQADIATIGPLEGLHVGLLTTSELEALCRLVRAGLADRVYEGAAGFLGLPKVRLDRAAIDALGSQP